MLVRAPILLLSLSLAGCVLSEVSLEGKQCPCVAGFICDQASNLCVPEGSPLPDAGAEDLGAALMDTGVVRDIGTPPVDLGMIDLGPGGDAGDAGPPPVGDTGVVDLGMDAGPIDMGPGPCQFDRECGPEEICSQGSCVSSCNSAGGAPCVQGSCDPSGHCFIPGQPCTNGQCAASSEVCIAGECKLSCTVSTAECTGDRICDPALGLCRVAPSCTIASDCPDPNFVCPAGECVRRCDAPGAQPCLGGSVCDLGSGLCTGGLALGDLCVANNDCSSGLCRPAPGGGGSVCSRPCGATSDCSLGFVCQINDGARGCFPAQSFAPGQDADVSSGQSCTNPANACQSLICESPGSTCTEGCSTTRHCAGFSERCALHQQQVGQGAIFSRRCFDAPGAVPVGGVCGGHLQCQSGLCDRFFTVCRELCCADSDCGVGENCVVYDVLNQIPITVCQAAGMGAAPDGAVCMLDSECASGVCAPVDPANLNGTRKCTTHCCDHQDCAALPGQTAFCFPLPSQLVVGAFTNTCVGF